MTVRDGSAEWSGDVLTGSGKITVGDGVFEGPYSFASRFEDGDGTNPEQLIAAALAGCFTMALSNQLADAGHPPQSLRTHAVVHMRNNDGEISLSRIDLETTGVCPDCLRMSSSATAERRRPTVPFRGRSPGSQTSR